MKKIFLFLLFATSCFSQFGHSGGGSLDLDELLPIIADSAKWTDGSTVNAIKPRDAKTVEADSGKFGALEVTGNTILGGNLTMVTTATEQVKLGTGSDAAPELSSVGDTDTGIRFTGGNKMQLVQGGLNSHTFRPYRYTMTYSDADSISFILDGTNALLKSNVGVQIYSFGSTRLDLGSTRIDLYTHLWPSLNDTYSIGFPGKSFKDYNGTDNINLGGKSQTARLLISGENTIAGTDSSWDINATGGVPTATAYHTGTFSNGGRRTYFGPDTLALFNGAKTGRDSTIAFMPQGQMQLRASGMSAANYMKGIRLENPDAATAGVQAVSPALTFKGSGWKTDATAGSDSVLWGMYVLPAQGTNVPTSRLYFMTKVGNYSWTPGLYITNAGQIIATESVGGTRFITTGANGIYTSNGNNAVGADADNSGSDGIISFGRSGYTSIATEYARFLHNGNLGLGTTTPGAKFEVAGAKSADTLLSVYNDKTGLTARDSSFTIGPDGSAYSTGKLVAEDSIRTNGTSKLIGNVQVGTGTNWFTAADSLLAIEGEISLDGFTVSAIDTVFTATYVPRWVKYTSGSKSWYSPVYADTTGKW